MAKRFNVSQFRSKIRQAQNQRKQAVRKFVNDYNSQVRKLNQAINQHNQKARAHNAKVRSQRQRLINELRRLESRRVTRYTFTVSATQLHDTFLRLEQHAERDGLTEHNHELFDLTEQETTNALAVAHAFEASFGTEESTTSLVDTRITNELLQFSPELDGRWRGALYALNPSNPDAIRHFSVSAREIFVKILDLRAPDNLVLDAIPDCELTPEKKTPSRRSKIRYLFHAKDQSDSYLEDYVQEDVENILKLFTGLNAGTHGPAGRISRNQLIAVKERVEDGLLFLTRVVF